jgi:hypothetical protein
MMMSSGNTIRAAVGHRSPSGSAAKPGATASAPPHLYALHDELLALASQLEPDALLALRATSAVLRERLNACVRLVEHVCTTSRYDSFCYDMTLSHFTKTTVRVPDGVGPRLAYSRWAVGDRAFVCFARALLARRVPSGDFVDVTPAEFKGSTLLFAAGWGRDVWVGTATSIVHARLTPKLTALERTCAIWRATPGAAAKVLAATCANAHGLFGIVSNGEDSLMRWSGSEWLPLLREFDVNITDGVAFAVSPGGAICFQSHIDEGDSFDSAISTLLPVGIERTPVPCEIGDSQDMCAMARGQILVGGGRDDDDDGSVGVHAPTLWLVPSSSIGAGCAAYVRKAALARSATAHSFHETDIAITYHWRIAPIVRAASTARQPPLSARIRTDLELGWRIRSNIRSGGSARYLRCQAQTLPPPPNVKPEHMA